ncbi:proline-specific peptidase [Myriangium duriaei CBS 260.36]|uniref:Proline-specific peptidase n=1 Tax=Myriangium duriaei CBS 260.36 TaxID=1168546 RepID=A0A9P4IZL1_9PEZI|nr:proline-specific peptidase [Myriangium duriaei CBS 260.36]
MTTQNPTEEGFIPYQIPLTDKPCSTYYKVFGDLTKATPLVCLHGGPGAGHDYMLAFAELWPRYGIPVVFYDHIGCGSSTHFQGTVDDKSLWQESLFTNELENLLDHLQIGSAYHLLGHSWGGMIAPTFAATQPRGLRKLVLASGIPSKKHSIRSFAQLKKELPEKHQQAIDEAVQTRDFESAGYKAAFGYLVRYYLCRTDVPPPEMLASYKKMAEDNTVLLATSGPSPYYQNGTFLEWSCVERLHRIAAPTLIYNAEFDTSSRDIAQMPFFELIPKVRWVKFMEAGHSVHLESEELKEKVLKLVGEFLVEQSAD